LNTIHVAAAAIRNQSGQILLSKRHPDSHQGNLWEFPGGKLEPGESVDSALQRELQEELGIQISEHRPLIRIRHDYADRRVLLDVHLVTASQFADSEQFLENLRYALQQGVSLLQFRVFGLETIRHRQLAQRSLELCREYAARMLVNHDLQLAQELDAHGVHLNRRQLQSLDYRPLPVGKLVSASCHSLSELHQAQALGADFAVLSPVLPTQSHPDADLLGWDGFAEIVDQINIPVYALGGMRLDLLQHVWTLGAQGVSGIRMKLWQ